jgi:hypothetical protein
MKAIYVFWSNREDNIMTDYTAITGILSMLYWKKNNGPIKIYLDNNTSKFFEKSGILDLDLIDEIDTKVLTSKTADKIKVKESHWVWGDIFAINDLNEDAVFLDWDNIFKETYIPNRDADMTYAHREKVQYPYYPHPIIHIDDYQNSEFSKFNWEAIKYTYNVSFLHFNNIELAKEFSYYSMKYLLNSNHQISQKYDYLNVRILFIIQYLLTAVTQKYKKSHIFTDIYDPFNNTWHPDENGNSNRNDDIMYHLWFNKKTLHINNEIYTGYMKHLFGQIINNFPEYLNDIIKILYPLSKWKNTKEYDFINIRPTNYNTGEVIKYI